MTVIGLTADVWWRAQGDPSSDMAEIFGRDEFRREPSWWERLRSTVGDLFDHLSFSWLGPVGQFLLWLLLVVAVVAAGAWLWRRWRGRTRRTTEPRDEIVPISADSVTDPDELRAAGAAFETERDFKQAILFRYRELVVVLMRARLVTNLPGRTTGELRTDLRESSAAAAEPFDAATAIFEVTWFSAHPATPEEFDELARLADATTEAAGVAAAAPSSERR